MSRSPPYSALPNHTVRRTISSANQSNASGSAKFSEPGNTGIETLREYAVLNNDSHLEASPLPARTRPANRSPNKFQYSRILANAQYQRRRDAPPTF